MKSRLTSVPALTALVAGIIALPFVAAEDPGDEQSSATSVKEPFPRMLIVYDRDGNERRYEVNEEGGRTWIGSTAREFVPDREAFNEDVDASLRARQSRQGVESRMIERDTFPDRPPEVQVIHPNDYAAEVQEIGEMAEGGVYDAAAGRSQRDDP